MAIPSFLQPAYMETVVSKQKRTYSTPILDMFFKKKQFVEEGFVRVPKEVESYDDILAIVERGAAIPLSDNNVSKGFYTFELRLFGDLKIVKPSDIEKYKRQLAGLTGETYKQKKIEIVNSIIGEYNRKVDLTREYMAGSALTGNIKDKDGNILETFDIPADNKLGTKNVSDGSVKIYRLLQDMVNRMSDATNYTGKVGVVIGANAYNKILDSEEYQKWANNPSNNLSALDIANGVEGYLMSKKYPFLLANAKFYNNGTKSKFFDEDTIILAPLEAFREYYTYIATNEGEFAKLKHIDNFKVYNPDGTAYRVQASSMPIVTLPNAIVSAKIA